MNLTSPPVDRRNVLHEDGQRNATSVVGQSSSEQCKVTTSTTGDCSEGTSPVTGQSHGKRSGITTGRRSCRIHVSRKPRLVLTTLDCHNYELGCFVRQLGSSVVGASNLAGAGLHLTTADKSTEYQLKYVKLMSGADDKSRVDASGHMLQSNRSFVDFILTCINRRILPTTLVSMINQQLAECDSSTAGHPVLDWQNCVIEIRFQHHSSMAEVESGVNDVHASMFVRLRISQFGLLEESVRLSRQMNATRNGSPVLAAESLFINSKPVDVDRLAKRAHPCDKGQEAKGHNFRCSTTFVSRVLSLKRKCSTISKRADELDYAHRLLSSSIGHAFENVQRVLCDDVSLPGKEGAPRRAPVASVFSFHNFVRDRSKRRSVELANDLPDFIKREVDQDSLTLELNEETLATKKRRRLSLHSESVRSTGASGSVFSSFADLLRPASYSHGCLRPSTATNTTPMRFARVVTRRMSADWAGDDVSQSSRLVDMTPHIVEEYILETAERTLIGSHFFNHQQQQPAGVAGIQQVHQRIYHTRLTILQRAASDEYLGQLYVERDFRPNEGKGSTCRFLLGSRAHALRYINQFTEIFTEEGRKSVRITHIVPNQQPRISFTPGMRERIAAAAAAQQQQQQQQQHQQQQLQQAQLSNATSNNVVIHVDQSAVKKDSKSIGPSTSFCPPFCNTTTPTISSQVVYVNNQRQAVGGISTTSNGNVTTSSSCGTGNSRRASVASCDGKGSSNSTPNPSPISLAAVAAPTAAAGPTAPAQSSSGGGQQKMSILQQCLQQPVKKVMTQSSPVRVTSLQHPPPPTPTPPANNTSVGPATPGMRPHQTRPLSAAALDSTSSPTTPSSSTSHQQQQQQQQNAMSSVSHIQQSLMALSPIPQARSSSGSTITSPQSNASTSYGQPSPTSTAHTLMLGSPQTGSRQLLVQRQIQLQQQQHQHHQQQQQQQSVSCVPGANNEYRLPTSTCPSPATDGDMISSPRSVGSCSGGSLANSVQRQRYIAPSSEYTTNATPESYHHQMSPQSSTPARPSSRPSSVLAMPSPTANSGGLSTSLTGLAQASPFAYHLDSGAGGGPPPNVVLPTTPDPSVTTVMASHQPHQTQLVSTSAADQASVQQSCLATAKVDSARSRAAGGVGEPKSEESEAISAIMASLLMDSERFQQQQQMIKQELQTQSTSPVHQQQHPQQQQQQQQQAFSGPTQAASSSQPGIPMTMLPTAPLPPSSLCHSSSERSQPCSSSSASSASGAANGGTTNQAVAIVHSETGSMKPMLIPIGAAATSTDFSDRSANQSPSRSASTANGSTTTPKTVGRRQNGGNKSGPKTGITSPATTARPATSRKRKTASSKASAQQADSAKTSVVIPSGSSTITLHPPPTDMMLSPLQEADAKNNIVFVVKSSGNQDGCGPGQTVVNDGQSAASPIVVVQRPQPVERSIVTLANGPVSVQSPGTSGKASPKTQSGRRPADSGTSRRSQTAASKRAAKQQARSEDQQKQQHHQQQRQQQHVIQSPARHIIVRSDGTLAALPPSSSPSTAVKTEVNGRNSSSPLTGTVRVIHLAAPQAAQQHHPNQHHQQQQQHQHHHHHNQQQQQLQKSPSKHHIESVQINGGGLAPNSVVVSSQQQQQQQHVEFTAQPVASFSIPVSFVGGGAATSMIQQRQQTTHAEIDQQSNAGQMFTSSHNFGQSVSTSGSGGAGAGGTSIVLSSGRGSTVDKRIGTPAANVTSNHQTQSHMQTELFQHGSSPPTRMIGQLQSGQLVSIVSPSASPIKSAGASAVNQTLLTVPSMEMPVIDRLPTTPDMGAVAAAAAAAAAASASTSSPSATAPALRTEQTMGPLKHVLIQSSQQQARHQPATDLPDAINAPAAAANNNNNNNNQLQRIFIQIPPHSSPSSFGVVQQPSFVASSCNGLDSRQATTVIYGNSDTTSVDNAAMTSGGQRIMLPTQPVEGSSPVRQPQLVTLALQQHQQQQQQQLISQTSQIRFISSGGHHHTGQSVMRGHAAAAAAAADNVVVASGAGNLIETVNNSGATSQNANGQTTNIIGSPIQGLGGRQTTV